MVGGSEALVVRRRWEVPRLTEVSGLCVDSRCQR